MVIHAHSPQAKGRVERRFKPLQDRLVKDLRLAGRSTIEAANQFVETWRPRDNRRVAVPPTQPADLHRPCPARRDLDRSRCLKPTRVLRRDWTVAHHGQLYQICDNIRATQVQVEERIDGTMRITHHGQPLTYQAIAARPVRVRALTPPAAPRRSVKPKLTPPWHRRVWPDRHNAVATSMT